MDRKQKAAEYQRRWRKANPDIVSEQTRRRRERDYLAAAPAREAAALRRATAPERLRLWHKDNHLQKKYGVTLDDVNRLLAAQGGRCAVCRTDTPTRIGWATDHDHATHKVRGILCNRCNAGIGYLRDSSATADAAARYLRSHGK